MEKIYQQSLRFHKKHRGKLNISSRVPLKSRHDLAMAYTPGVAAVCRAIAKHPKLAQSYTIKRNSVAIVSDGSAVLGLGNLGPLAALPVMEGKAILFKEFAGINAFPICLNTQDTEEIIRTVVNIAPVFGGINLEDISAPRAFEIEKRLKEILDIPVLHDDQHGTATVILAALINALKLKRLSKTQVKIVINGAGSAGIAVAKLLHKYGFKHMITCDSHGIIFAGRKNLSQEKAEVAKLTKNKQKGQLADAIKGADVFIGVSAPGVLLPKMIRTMNSRPVVFALANPKPEIMPEAAKKAGAFIVASGRSDFPNQINNVLAFPGIFRGALDHSVKKITDAMLMRAAQNLAASVKNPRPSKVLPDIFNQNVVPAVARAIK